MLNKRGTSFVVLGDIGLNYDNPEPRLDLRMAHADAGTCRAFSIGNRSLTAIHMRYEKGHRAERRLVSLSALRLVSASGESKASRLPGS
jgi:hypothetical protein